MSLLRDSPGDFPAEKHPLSSPGHGRCRIGVISKQQGKGLMNSTVNQRNDERSRMTAVGKRTDDGSKCTLLAVRKVGGDWCLYPHGADQLGVRLPGAEAVRVAQAILDGAR